MTLPNGPHAWGLLIFLNRFRILVSSCGYLIVGVHTVTKTIEKSTRTMKRNVSSTWRNVSGFAWPPSRRRWVEFMIQCTINYHTSPLPLISAWLHRLGRRGSSKESVRTTCGSHLVALWFHYHCFLHSQFGCFFDCLTVGRSNWVIGRPEQAVQDPICPDGR